MSQQINNSNINYNDAIEMLHGMFADWDKETLGIILESNNYHLESTIEQCLTMSGGETSKSNDSQKQPEKSESVDLLDLGNDAAEKTQIKQNETTLKKEKT